MRVQVWLALHSLLADGEARSKMDLSEGRCEALLRMKRHFNELLLDQVWWGVVGRCLMSRKFRRQGNGTAAH